MANRHRGEISAELGGKTFPLCLTLGALAELEDALGARDLADIGARFESGRVSARDLLAILGAGLRGAGASLSDAEIARLDCKDGLAGYLKIVCALLSAAFGPEEPAARPPSGGKPDP